MNRIPSTKASPEHVLDLMTIIKNNSGNIESMKKEIHSYLLEKSPRGKRDAYNSVYAITFPTLRRLGLIENKGQNIHLSHDGEILLAVYFKRGVLEYTRAFAKIILRVDFEKAHVIKYLLSWNRDDISIEELADLLRKQGIDTSTKDDRLLKWLRYLKFVRFIEASGSLIKINRFQIEAIKRGESKVKYDEFVNLLIEEYNRLKAKNRGNIYVKIPELERNVCKALFKFNFTTFDFRVYLGKLKNHKFKNMKIIFSKPGAREEGGITLDNIYYYYISIYT